MNRYEVTIQVTLFLKEAAMGMLELTDIVEAEDVIEASRKISILIGNLRADYFSAIHNKDNEFDELFGLEDLDDVEIDVLAINAIK